MPADRRQAVGPAVRLRGGGLMRTVYALTLVIILLGLVYAIVIGALGQ
jgi:hypothetical protein